MPTDVTFRVTFDDYPDPDTVRSDSMLLTTGFFWVPGSYGVDLIGKAAVDAPDPALSRRARVLAAPAARRSRRWPAARRRARTIEFITGDGPAGDAPPPPAPFESVQAIFDASCAGSGCHLRPDDGGGCLAAPAAGLSLCAAEAWDPLVDVPSRAGRLLQPGRAGDSARSYLLRKLLPATAAGGPIPGVSASASRPGEPLPEDQLRAIAAWIDGGALR